MTINADTPRFFPTNRKRIVLWTSYLCAMSLLPFVMAYLVEHVALPLGAARDAERAAQRATLARGIFHLEGLAYRLHVPALAAMADTVDAPSRSPAVLCEDERVLGPAHSGHRDIVNLGGGRFSHWGVQVIFSSSDGSDPITNRRHYRLSEGDCSLPFP